MEVFLKQDMFSGERKHFQFDEDGNPESIEHLAWIIANERVKRRKRFVSKKLEAVNIAKCEALNEKLKLVGKKIPSSYDPCKFVWLILQRNSRN
jgi:hypothetical protein